MQKKETLEIAVTVLLVAALMFFIARAVKRLEHLRHKKPDAAVSGERALSFPASPEGAGKGLLERWEAQTKGLVIKRDPFSDVPISSSQDCPHGFCLKGIVWSAQNPSAIINDKIVKVGDEAAGDIPARVVEINEREVVLNSGSELIRLNLD